MPESLFITGGSGFVGSRLLSRLNEVPIFCLGRNRPATGPAKVHFVQADLLETARYAKALAQCGTVVHLAAATGKTRPAEYFRVNREGTRALVAACRQAGVQRFIYISTIAAKFPDQQRYYYAQSKRQAEEIVAASGLRYTIVRPTMVMGKASPVLASLRRLASAPVIPIFGNGRAQVQPVAVDDLVGFLADILHEGSFENQIVEFGGPQVLSMEDLLIRIRGGARAPVLHLPAAWMAAGVGFLEKGLLPLLPFTAGQIASFVNDGTAVCDPRLAKWRNGMQSLDQMLA
jgi:NADH dehydrogenase